MRAGMKSSDGAEPTRHRWRLEQVCVELRAASVGTWQVGLGAREREREGDGLGYDDENGPGWTRSRAKRNGMWKRKRPTKISWIFIWFFC